MVAESQRRTLLYPKLVKAFFEAYPAHGCEFCYAEVTRPRVLAANLALGFRRIGRLPVYVRPYLFQKLAQMQFGRFADLFRPVSWLAKVLARAGIPLAGRRCIVSEAPSFPDTFAPFLQDASGQFKVTALRTVPILNWRFTRNPDRSYRIFLAREGNRPVGYIVLRRMPMREFDALAVVDLLCDVNRSAVGHALLRVAHKLAVRKASTLRS